MAADRRENQKGGDDVTPEEAVEKLGKQGAIMPRPWRTAKPAVLVLFKAVASTAHDNETRRCSDYVRNDRGLNWLADDLLRTGGLEVKP